MTTKRNKRTKLAKLSENNKSYPTIKIEIEGNPPPNRYHEMSVMDINENGMGITCLAPLKVGQHIIFTDNNHEWELPEKGVVMWTFNNNEGFRAGIKFI